MGGHGPVNLRLVNVNKDLTREQLWLQGLLCLLRPAILSWGYRNHGGRLTGHYGAGQGGKIMGLWLCPMTLLKFNEGISVG